MNASRRSAISEHWAAKYVGKPWLPGGRGPDAFDCWGLLRSVVANDFKRPLLPDYPINPKALPLVAAEINKAISGPEWTQLEKPVDGCAVGLARTMAFLHHVGLFAAVDGGMILHADEPRVVAVPVRAMRSRGWPRIEFYWHQSWSNPRT